MTTNRFPITIYINENSEHEAEDIFDSIQLPLADEFGGEAEAFSARQTSSLTAVSSGMRTSKNWPAGPPQSSAQRRSQSYSRHL